MPGYVATGWYGLSAPRNTPPEVVNKLNQALNGALADPKAKERLTTLGVQPLALSPSAFRTFIDGEYDKWSPVIKSASIKVD